MTGVHTFYLQDFYGYLLVFARFAGFFSFAPLFSENRVNARLRLLLTLMVTMIVAPTVLQNPSLKPAGGSLLFDVAIIAELVIGFFAALVARILMAALEVAGPLIGFQMSLANAFSNSPATAQQSGLPAVYLSMIGALLIFVTDFHHVMILLMVESFQVFQPGGLQNFAQLAGDMNHTLVKFLSASFLLGLQIAAPVTIMGLLMFATAGIVNRLIPQVQIFFILQPLQILLGFTVLTLSVGLLMSYFIKDFASKYQALWNTG